MGRPPLGLKMIMLRVAPEVLKRIRRFEKNVSSFIRNAIEKELLRLEKKSKKEKD
jgi:hypothetical protein